MFQNPNRAKHIPVPKNTLAFICAHCGAVSLDPLGICQVQGKGTKADWCGTPTTSSPVKCINRINKLRFDCNTCGKLAVNPELLCQPKLIVE